MSFKTHEDSMTEWRAKLQKKMRDNERELRLIATLKLQENIQERTPGIVQHFTQRIPKQ